MGVMYTIKNSTPDGLHGYGRTASKAECEAAVAESKAYFGRALAQYEEAGMGDSEVARRLRNTRIEVVLASQKQDNPSNLKPGVYN